MSYRAIFFDRDGTLTKSSPGWEHICDEKLSELSGQSFAFGQELFERIYEKVLRDGYTKHMDN